MNKKNLFWGIVLILLAAYLIVERVGLIPKLPILTILLTVIFVYMIIRGIMKWDFFEIFLPAALIGCLYDKELHITEITPWILLLAALLVSAGLTLIFKNTKKKTEWKNYAFANSHIDNSQDGSYVQVHNSFNGTSKYVNSNFFAKADVNNTFGQCNVFFNNAVIANGNAIINVKNSFGEVNLYLPGTWRVDVKRDCAFGDVKMYGEGNHDMDAPFVQILADCNFGQINIYFE